MDRRKNEDITDGKGIEPELRREVNVFSLVMPLSGYRFERNHRYPQILWITLWNTLGKPAKIPVIKVVFVKLTIL